MNLTGADVAAGTVRFLDPTRVGFSNPDGVEVPLLQPGTVYDERLHQFDVRIGKSFEVGGTRLRAMLDIANLFNENTILDQEQVFGPNWLRPSEILLGRLFKPALLVDGKVEEGEGAMTHQSKRQVRSPLIRALSLPAAVAITLIGAESIAAGQSRASGEVTFTQDIAPILQRSCQSCHRPGPGGGAPMSLLTYSDVRPWARAIKDRTERRTMPPWFIDKNVGIQRFKDDPSLSDDEIAMIARWVDGGAPQGNPADMPPPREFPDGKEWTIGTPDWIVSSPEVTVQAVASDWHGYLESTPTRMTEDRFIKAVEVHEVRVQGSTGKTDGLGGYSVVHHAGIVAGTAGESVTPGPVGRIEGAFGMTHEAGQNATRYTDGVGITLPAESSLHWRVHLSSFGEEVVTRLDVGFAFHPEGYTPKYTAPGPGVFLTFNDLDIPAGATDLRFDAMAVTRNPSKLVTFEPHMHAGGRRMCLNAQYPDGLRETLTCAGYDHNWVKVYSYADDAAPLIPAGTILHAIAWYDNSQGNRNILEPRNWHGLGSRSMDDMFFFLGQFVGLTEEQYEEELAARQQAGNRPTAQND